MTAGSYPDDGLGEVFLKLGKQGSTLAGVMDAFSMAISISLQYGVPLETYVQKFTNMKFEPAGLTDDPDIRMSQSIMDYIFRRLALDYLSFDERAELGIYTATERARQVETGSYLPEDEELSEAESLKNDAGDEVPTDQLPVEPRWTLRRRWRRHRRAPTPPRSCSSRSPAPASTRRSASPAARRCDRAAAATSARAAAAPAAAAESPREGDHRPGAELSRAVAATPRSAGARIRQASVTNSTSRDSSISASRTSTTGWRSHSGTMKKISGSPSSSACFSPSSPT